MPQAAWSEKRERQYQHIKESVQNQGGNRAKRAEEIAARTVNKERAQHGETKSASKTTLNSTPAPSRGGLRAHRGDAGRTHAQLYKDAQARNITGRSTMNKAQLERALGTNIKRTR
ncbi:plasmid stabilization protein [uncultured Oxalicibacterium sp.]|uniref:plasmid stabilization protein n=1 Tax=uncultured Oxalicibacterium sp. TaxID=1168540 RepID=UPI0025EE1194|nr:plasmid stabilization protein [uncultured Oxalicibacterium sp.]